VDVAVLSWLERGPEGVKESGTQWGGQGLCSVPRWQAALVLVKHSYF
jgi:hypothetical protein